LFFHQPTSVREKVLSQLDIPFSTKVLLYAPTFRERKDSTKYLLNASQLSSFLKELTGEDWVILVRLHPHLHLQHLGEEMNRQVREVTRYEEVQELLAASDMLISDYSSLVFDFALTARPCFLYLPDLDEYVARERKLYFALDQLPFPYSRNEEELKTQIKILNEKDYRSRLTAFMQQTGSYEQGSASANVVAYIKQKIGA
jgi:CDP-glycerol glycerophosphotransferase